MKLFNKNITFKASPSAKKEGEAAADKNKSLKTTPSESLPGDIKESAASEASHREKAVPVEGKAGPFSILKGRLKRRKTGESRPDADSGKKQRRGLSLPSRITKTEKTDSSKKKKKKGKQKKGGDNRLVILLMPVLLILLGILLKDPAVNFYKNLTRPEPAPAPVAAVKSGPALTSAYEEGEDLLSWNLTEDLLGVQTIEFLKGNTMNLWMEYNERGVLLYHELLNKDVSSEERDALLRFLPRLKVIHTREDEPMETLFLLKLRYEEGEEKLSPDFHFFTGKSQAVNFLMGRPLDYVEDDSRPANATQPVITGRISGIMIGNTASVLLDSGERIVVGDKVREGVVREILPRYILVEKNGKVSKFYVGQSI